MGALKNLFGGGDRPATPMPAAPATPAAVVPTASGQEAALRDNSRLMAGMAGTVLTGPLGLRSRPRTTRRGASTLGG